MRGSLRCETWAAAPATRGRARRSIGARWRARSYRHRGGSVPRWCGRRRRPRRRARSSRCLRIHGDAKSARADALVEEGGVARLEVHPGRCERRHELDPPARLQQVFGGAARLPVRVAVEDHDALPRCDAARQHVVDRDHPGIVGNAGDEPAHRRPQSLRCDGRARSVGGVAPRQVGARAGGDDRRVGAECLDRVRARLHPQAKIDPEAFRLRGEVLRRLPDLGVQRLARGEADEAARLALPFEQGDAMAAPGKGDRGAQPGRTAARHRHVAARRGGRHGAAPALAPGFRVLHAPDRMLLHDLKDAGVVAGDARSHLAEAAVADLVGELRVRNELSRHADEVGIALPENPLRIQRILDSAEGDNRQRGRALEGGVEVVEDELRHRRRRDLHPEAAERTRVGAEEIDVPACRERPGDRKTVVEVVAERGVLVQAEADRDGPVGADPVPHRRQHLEGETHAVLEGAAVGILPAVEERRDEAAQEAVMADLDLDPVVACVAHVCRRRREPLDDRLDLHRPHLDGVVARAGLGHLGRRPELARRVGEGGVPAMRKLGEDVCAVGMDRIDDPPVGRKRLPVPGPAVIGGHLAGRMHGVAAGHDEADPALRPRRIVGGEVLRRRPVRRVEPVPVGQHDEAVAELDAAQAKRRPEQRIAVHRSTVSLLVRAAIGSSRRGTVGRGIGRRHSLIPGDWSGSNVSASPVSPPSWVAGGAARRRR